MTQLLFLLGVRPPPKRINRGRQAGFPRLFIQFHAAMTLGCTSCFGFNRSFGIWTPTTRQYSEHFCSRISAYSITLRAGYSTTEWRDDGTTPTPKNAKPRINKLSQTPRPLTHELARDTTQYIQHQQTPTSTQHQHQHNINTTSTQH